MVVQSAVHCTRSGVRLREERGQARGRRRRGDETVRPGRHPEDIGGMRGGVAPRAGANRRRRAGPPRVDPALPFRRRGARGGVSRPPGRALHPSRRKRRVPIRSPGEARWLLLVAPTTRRGRIAQTGEFRTPFMRRTRSLAPGVVHRPWFTRARGSALRAAGGFEDRRRVDGPRTASPAAAKLRISSARALRPSCAPRRRRSRRAPPGRAPRPRSRTSGCPS